MKNLVVEEGMPASQDAVDKNSTPSHFYLLFFVSRSYQVTEANYADIAKYFGQSTADGIQFQFRTIKKDADHLRQVHNSGGDVANCLPLGTPTKSVRTPGSRKRGRDVKPSSDESEDVEKDWSEEESPSKRGRALPSGQKNGGTRRAAVRANATIASAAEQDEQEHEQEDDGQRAIAVKEEYVSLFGDPGAGGSMGAFTELSTDPVISSTMNMSMYSDAFYEGVGDDYLEGEI